MKNSDRELDMINRYKNGEVLQEIGDVYGISRERVRQIIAKCGVKSESGGVNIRNNKRMFEKSHEFNDKKEARVLKLFGCTAIQYDEIKGRYPASHSKSPIKAYRVQKNRAKNRGIIFNLTLPEWWNIWQESGKWDKRGRGKGKYAMCRIADCGDYEKNNVEIISFVKNVQDYYSIYSDRWYKKVHGDKPCKKIDVLKCKQ